ncbi:FAD-dependent oxidoreductase [Cryobacterium sp. PH29-G1]|uniref:FAD-dependent oxidoreductase n=1 Tax=Cryobacterium sp. PH29-G1 TaxID=3046211 RepID=UPI0024B8D246|nr:FAD-dependent oxidoreductase [Cryobacterium sp. PH29-G1]MDJ0348853.1 FAD-dependent oxidoreductase [Cryobacterium sp. PH29-G1]
MDGDLAVIGVGTTGSMILWRSSLRPGSVVGFDATYPASDHTAVGGDSRMFRMAYKEGSQYSGLLANSERLWKELGALGGTRILDQSGGALTITTDDGDYVRSLRSSARASGADFETLQPDELRRRFPQHEVLPGDLGLFDPRGGLLRTDVAVLNAVEQAKANGATVHQTRGIDAVVPQDGFVEIHSGQQSWTFKRVVISAGAWSRDLLPKRYAEHVKPGRILLTWFSSREPANFENGRFPAFMRDSGDVHMWGAPTLDGNMVKLGGICRPNEIVDLDAMNRELTPAELDDSHAAVDRLLPGLMPVAVRAKAYPDLYTRDAQPLIGWLPELPGVYVATGFSGKGFKMAAGVGESVTRDLFGEPPSANIDFARPHRFADPAVLDQSWGRLVSAERISR